MSNTWRIVIAKPENFAELIDQVVNPECLNCTSAHALLALFGEMGLEGVNAVCPGSPNNASMIAAENLLPDNNEVRSDLKQPCSFSALRTESDG